MWERWESRCLGALGGPAVHAVCSVGAQSCPTLCDPVDLASLTAQLVKNPPAMQETWVGKISWRWERRPTPVFWPGESHGLHSPWSLRVRHTRLSRFHSLPLCAAPSPSLRRVPPGLGEAERVCVCVCVLLIFQRPSGDEFTRVLEAPGRRLRQYISHLESSFSGVSSLALASRKPRAICVLLLVFENTVEVNAGAFLI